MSVTMRTLIYVIASFILSITPNHSGGIPIQNIVGGTSVAAEEHPYIAAMLYSGVYYTDFLICGGSILRKESPAVILTAAHCVAGGFEFDSHKIRLYASDYNAAYNAITNNYIDSDIIDVVVHPDYAQEDLPHDIALIYISSDISTITRLETVSIESISPSDVEPCNANDSLQVVGYGNDVVGGSNTDTLEDVTIPYVTRADCNLQYNDSVTNEMICAGGNGVDACQGDSGGPLLRENTNEEIGIVSWGRGCAVDAGVYTNVGIYYDWINVTLNDYVMQYCVKTDITTIATITEILSGNEEHYTYTISDVDVDRLYIGIEGIGDADLYVKYGAIPNDTSYDCAPLKGYSSESCAFDAEIGTYYIMIVAFANASSLTLTATEWQCSDEPPTSDPTMDPTTSDPTCDPTHGPTSDPTHDPTSDPTEDPTTSDPTSDPTHYPTNDPITRNPTHDPTSDPTKYPTTNPTTNDPTSDPTHGPTRDPTTSDPTHVPTSDPVSAPTTHLSLFTLNAEMKLRAKDCVDQCIYDRDNSAKTGLVNCGSANVLWKISQSDNNGIIQFQNVNSGLKMMKKKTQLQTRSSGQNFEVSTEVTDGEYYIQLKHVASGQCVTWDVSCVDDVVNLGSSCSYNIQIIEYQAANTFPDVKSTPNIKTMPYLRLTTSTVAFLTVLFLCSVCWTIWILKLEVNIFKKKGTESKSVDYYDNELGALMDW